MLYINEFCYGLVFAFGLIIPLGAQNMFVISQGISNENKFQVMMVATTAAICDTLLIGISILGLSGIIMKWELVLNLFFVFGICFIFVYGFKLLRTKYKESSLESSVSKKTSKLIYITILLSLLNPYALLDTVGTIGTFSLSYHTLDQRLVFGLGCIVTSWVWFYFLAFFGRLVMRFDWVTKYQNQIFGAIMVIVGVLLTTKFISMMFFQLEYIIPIPTQTQSYLFCISFPF